MRVEQTYYDWYLDAGACNGSGQHAYKGVQQCGSLHHSQSDKFGIHDPCFLPDDTTLAYQAHQSQCVAHLQVQAVHPTIVGAV
jgi:hypothetical protein